MARFRVGQSDEILQLEEGTGIVFERIGSVLRLHAGVPSSLPKSVYTAGGVHLSHAATHITGAGVAGIDNTAMVVMTHVVPANTLTQVGDRLRVRSYWSGDTGNPVTGTAKLGPPGAEVTISHTTDAGGATLQLNEAWLHYIDDTHANIIEDEAGGLGILSAPNVAGFSWSTDQNVLIAQDAIVNNHIIVYAVIVDIFPKGVA
jgi:hypothetical protein